jgi:hypothetical protein
MPLYLFQHPKTEEIKEIFQGMNDLHEYSENGTKWLRIFTKPTASIDTKINPNSANDFVNHTKNKNYSIGDMWDISSELSDKRAKVSGQDPVKQKVIDDYEKKTKKLHPSKTSGEVIEI